jgi:hypothetical protein
VRTGSWGRVAAILAALSRTSARGDPEETEARLKLAGVPPELRTRIHDAIDRGVRYLSSRQREDGSFQPDRRVPNPNREGHTAICGLALRHAGTPLGTRNGRRAIDWLVPAGSVGRPAIYKDIYVCGLTNLLLLADRRHPEIAAEVARYVAISIDKRTGWWSYFTRYRGPVERVEWSGSVVQLSTTQFAGLAMWAGSRDGGAAHRTTWRSHAYSLCGFQTTTGSWAYAPILPPANGYPTGTFMGLANLLLAEAALGPRLALEEPDLAFRIERAKSAGMRALARDARRVLKELRDGTVGSARTYGELSRGGSGWGYYSLYALEKACVFAGVEELEGVRWYAEGATSLVGAQRADGAWVPNAGLQAPSNPFDVDITTAFALLFLLRDAESYRATTPRSVDASKGPITPTDGSDALAPGAEPPKPPSPEGAPPG